MLSSFHFWKKGGLILACFAFDMKIDVSEHNSLLLDLMILTYLKVVRLLESQNFFTHSLVDFSVYPGKIKYVVETFYFIQAHFCLMWLDCYKLTSVILL